MNGARAVGLLTSGALFIAASAALAMQPSDDIDTPELDDSTRELDLRFGSLQAGAPDRESEAAIGYSWRMLPRWSTELGIQIDKHVDSGARFSSVEWENCLQLTKQKALLDVALLSELELTLHADERSALRVGALLQKTYVRTSFNLNLLLEHAVAWGASTPSSGPAVQFGYQWQIRHSWRPALAIGMQGAGHFGETGSFDADDGSAHRAGPAVWGTYGSAAQQVTYNAAWLVGSHATGRHAFRLQIEYEL
jgi:hypothetical protein